MQLEDMTREALVAEVRRLREEVERLCACDCASREDGNPHHQGFCRSLPTSLKRERAKRFAECYSTLAADTRNVNDLARQLADAHDETATARAEVEDWRDKWAIVDEDRCEAQRERDAARAEAERQRERADKNANGAWDWHDKWSRVLAEAVRLREQGCGYGQSVVDDLTAALRTERLEAARVREALQAVRELHQPDETPDELIWLGDGPCPDCGADNDERECEGHPTICCRHCQQQHPEDGMLVSPVPWPCATVRALDAALDGAE